MTSEPRKPLYSEPEDEPVMRKPKRKRAEDATPRRPAITRRTIPEIIADWDKSVDMAVRYDAMLPHTGELMKASFRCESAALLRVIADEMEKWTRRCDDAKRIPDVLYERADNIANTKLGRDAAAGDRGDGG